MTSRDFWRVLAMKNIARQQSKGIEFILSSLKEAHKRFAELDSEEKLRSANMIWEAYCDVEQAIEISKFVFNLHERLGKVRSLKVSSKNDPKTIPLDTLV